MSLVVVTHDAGGAELLSSYVRQRGLEPICVLEGPARAVFARKLPGVEQCALSEALERATSVLCGTSWQSNLEFDAMRFARAQGKHCVAFLDHWVNFAERFVRAGQSVRPDEIWVADTIAAGLAAAHLPGSPVLVVPNPYLEDCAVEFAALAKGAVGAHRGVHVLYVCEPVKEHARLRFGNERHFGYVEEEALRYFLANLHLLGGEVTKIRIRPHPSETPGKYDWVRDHTPVPVEVGGARTLLEEMVECDVVVGCESMAMVVALTVGKRVVSTIPPGGRACRLPQPQIEWLTRMAPKTGACASEFEQRHS